MQNDAVFHLEIRFDSYSADVTWVLFRNRGILPIQAEAGGYSLDFQGQPPFGTDEVKEVLLEMARNGFRA